MSRHITVADPSGLSKKQLGEYVSQMARLERDIYALEEAEKQLRADATSEQNKAYDIKHQSYVPDLPKPEEPKWASKPNYVKDAISYFTDDFLDTLKMIGITGAIGSFVLLFVVCSFCVVIGINPATLEPMDTAEETVEVEHDVPESEPVPVLLLATFFVGFAASPVLVYTIGYLSDKKSYKKYLTAKDKYNEEMKVYSAKIKERSDAYSRQCANDAMPLIAVANAYILQADTLNKKLAELRGLRNEMYSTGIIPPDYRTFDCVYGLDHIFRNDLADNMREAVLQYEDRVFKGVVVKGMSNILSSLNRLSTSMAYLTTEIQNVNNNIYNMCLDINDLVGRTTDLNRTNQYILEESKATRYAVQSMKGQMDYIYKTDYLHVS